MIKKVCLLTLMLFSTVRNLYSMDCLAILGACAGIGTGVTFEFCSRYKSPTAKLKAYLQNVWIRNESYTSRRTEKYINYLMSQGANPADEKSYCIRFAMERFRDAWNMKDIDEKDKQNRREKLVSSCNLLRMLTVAKADNPAIWRSVLQSNQDFNNFSNRLVFELFAKHAKPLRDSNRQEYLKLLKDFEQHALDTEPNDKEIAAILAKAQKRRNSAQKI